MTKQMCHRVPGLEHRLVGDPVDVVTGANTDTGLDFSLWGPLPLTSWRYYSSARTGQKLSLGNGHGHELGRTLRMGVDGVIYRDATGEDHPIGAITEDGGEVMYGRFRLRRADGRTYRLFEPGEPAADFEFLWGFERPARLRRLTHGLDSITLTYSQQAALTSITDSRSRRIAVEEAPDGRILRMVLEASDGNPQRQLVSYEYDQAGNLTRIVDPYASEVRFAYDASNRMIRRTDRNGFSFLFEYDKLGRCVRSRGEDGVLDTIIRYDAQVGLTVVRRADGGEWQYFFDPESKAVTRVVDPLGGSKQYIADAKGRPLQEIDELGNPTRVICSAAGAPIAKALPDGRTVRLPADPSAFEPPPHREPVCAAEFEHGWLLDWRHQTPPYEDARAQLDLPLAVHQALLGRPFGEKAPYELAQPEPPPPGTSSYRLPLFGREFDNLGKLVRQHGPGGAARRWQYDRNGNITRFVDFDGHEHRYEFKSFNQPISRSLPGGLEVRMEWTPTDQLRRFTDAGGTTTEFVHDLRDQLIEIRRAGTLKERYTLDAAGNVVGKSGSDGKTLVTVDIGPGNRPIRKTLAVGGVQEYAYDDAGRLAAISANGQTTEFAYDAYGRRSKDARDDLGVQHRPLTGTRPGWTRTLGVLLVSYGHRADGGVELRDPTGRTHRVRALGNGIVRRQFANGTVEVSQYDSRGRCLTKIVHRLNDDAPVWRRAFTYSGEGDLLRVDDSRAGVWAYSYDGAHRITSVRAPGRPDSLIAHDAAGNLHAMPGLRDVAIGPCNRLGSANDDSFEYNHRHHVSSRRGRVNHEYEYDSRDQLIRVRNDRGEWTAAYDPLGRRTSVNDRGKLTRYYWDGDRLAAEIGPDGRVRAYIYEYPLAMTPMLFIDLDSIEADPKTGRVYTVLANQIGAPVAVEDDAGRTVWSAVYEPYGAATIDPSSSIEFSFRFPGHWFDSSTGLHYNRFRYYSPELGRYLQSDPAGISGGDNLYAYVASPLSFVDLRGMACEACLQARAIEEEAALREGKAPSVASVDDDAARASVAMRVGMEEEDLLRLQYQIRAGEDNGKERLIIIRATNADAMNFHDEPGYSPKNEDIKLKTQTEAKAPDGVRDHDGLVTEAAQNWKDPDVQDNFRKLQHKGYDFDDEGVLRGPPDGTGDRYYGDHDMHGIWERPRSEDGDTNYTRVDSNKDEAKAWANEPFDGRQMVQHGGQDDWEVNDKPGRQPGWDEHFLVVEPPDGTARVVGPPAYEMQKYYEEQGLDWPYDDFSNCPPDTKPKPKS
jgi:RHS repeat-associated protein